MCVKFLEWWLAFGKHLINEMVVVVVFVKICVKSKRKALSSARNIYMRIKITGYIAGKERMNETKFSPT